MALWTCSTWHYTCSAWHYTVVAAVQPCSMLPGAVAQCINHSCMSSQSTPLVQTVCICLPLVQTQGFVCVPSALAAFFFPCLSQDWVVVHVQVRQWQAAGDASPDVPMLSLSNLCACQSQHC